MVFESLSQKRPKDSGWFPRSTKIEPGALTVAGQWRTFTAFPSILTIAVVNAAEKQACVIGFVSGHGLTVPQIEHPP